MRKAIIRYFTLFLILLLVAAFSALPAAAAEEETKVYEGTPLFLVAIVDSKGEPSGLLNAFLVHDPETGGTFLLGSSVLYDFAQNDYTILLLGDDDYITKAVALEKKGAVTYMYAPGLEKAPYLLLSEGSGTQTAVMYRELDEEKISDPIGKTFDLNSGWEENSNGFLTYTGHELESLYMVGAPMVFTEDSSVLGSITMNSDSEMLLAPIARGTLSTEYCIETLNGGNPSPDSSSSPEESFTESSPSDSGNSSGGRNSSDSGSASGSNSKSKSGYIWLAVIGAASVLYWFRRKHTGKQQAEKTEGTIPFDQPLTVPEEDSSSKCPQAFTPAVRDLAGRIYRADSSERLSFGRSSSNTICITGETVSSSHCVLYRENGALYLMDIGSTNGTFFSQRDRLKPNVPYRIRKGMAFFLSSPNHTFVVVEE